MDVRVGERGDRERVRQGRQRTGPIEKGGQLSPPQPCALRH